MQITNFSPEVLLHVVSWCNLSDLLEISVCCRRLKVIAYHDSLFELMLIKLGFFLSNRDNDYIREAWKRVFPQMEICAKSTRKKLFLTKSKSNIRRESIKHICIHLRKYYTDFKHNSALRILDLPQNMQTIYFCLLIRFCRISPTLDYLSVQQNIESCLCTLETNLFESFSNAKDEDNLKELIFDLYFVDGGQKCFVSLTNSVFLQKYAVFTETLGLKEVNDFMDEMGGYLEEQIAFIERIFPNPAYFGFLLVKKTLEQCVSGYLKHLLKSVSTIGPSLFLDTLTLVFEKSALFIGNLKNIDSCKLQRLLHDVLLPFKPAYGQIEVSFTQETHSNQAKDYLNSIKTTVTKTPILTHRDKKTRLNVLINIKNALLDKNQNFIPIDSPQSLSQAHLEGLLSMELVHEMLKTNVKSCKRTLVMLGTINQARPCIEKMVSSLLSNITQYQEACFKIAMSRISEFKPADVEVLPLADFFRMISKVDLILEAVDDYFVMEIGKFLNINDFLSDLTKERKAFNKNLDSMIAIGLDNIIMALMAQADYILSSEQLPSDFDCTHIDPKPTDACVLAIECVQRHVQIVRERIDTNLVKVFAEEVGTRFFQLVCKHIKKMRVSTSGGFRLMCDVNAYCSWGTSAGLSDSIVLFETLKEIMNVFIVTDVPALKNLLRDPERYAGVFRVEEVYEFVRRRTDYMKIKSQVKESECVIC